MKKSTLLKCISFMLATVFCVSTGCVFTIPAAADDPEPDAPAFTVKDAAGNDVTDLMTDGDFDTCVDGDAHWYWMPEKPVWYIQNGVLVIGGVGTLGAGENFGRFNDEIHTIVVAPQDPLIKYGGDFGVETGVVLEKIDAGAFAGLTNVTKAYIPLNVLLDADAFDSGVTPTLFRSAAKELTVAPATGYGIFNENGKTLLKLSIKDGEDDLVLGEGQKIAIVYTDGEKNNEGGLFFCSALKYSELQPTYENGQFIFDICAPVGSDQFIPIRQATYIANVYVLNADGSIAAQGSSAQFAIRCGDHPVVTERTADYTYLSNENYVTVDLGKKVMVDEFSLAFYDTSDRYYQWQLYASNDPDLPLCKWKYIGEKSNEDVSSTGFYTVPVDGAYRYLRAVCAYASNRWSALFAEVNVEVNEEAPIASLRVGSYNIQNGQNPGINHDFAVLALDILDAGLDVVGLQEVDKNNSRNGNQDTIAILKDLTGYYGEYAHAIDLYGGEYGTGILSKYPIVSYETVALPGPGESRSMGHAVIDIDGTLIDYYNTHLEWSSGEGRRNQLAYLKGIFADKECAILTGDLNTSTPEEYVPSFPLCNFANYYGSEYITNEDGAIDHIISTKNTIRQVQTGMIDEISNRHSDHNMLWADLEIKSSPALREEDGGFRWYENGDYLTGWQKIGYDDMYFDPQTGLMVSENFEDYEFEEFTACGKTLYRTPLHIERIITYPYVTNARGADVTAKLTDGSISTYIDGNDQSHWYFQPEGPLWYIQNGVLVVGGIGTLEEGQKFGRFNDEIHTIVVAPQDPLIKYGGDFGVETGVVLEKIDAGAFKGLTNVTKAYIPLNVTLDSDAFDPGVTPTLYRSAAKSLTVAPATGYGIFNENNKTLLKLSIKDNGSDLVLEEGQKIAILYTDGEKNNEGGTFFCSALKYSEIQPTYENGQFIFDICAPVGADQFIPVRQATYIANVYVLNADGSIAAQGSSAQFAIRCSDHPIVTERTADYTYLSADNYVTYDLGEEKEITSVSVAFINSSDRYYLWQLYGTNDPTLPIGKWDFLGEKMTQELSSEGAYTIELENASYRYLRPYALYASNRWTALFAEISVMTNDVSDEWTYDENYHWHLDLTTGEEAPGTRAAHTPGDWIVDAQPEGTTPGSKHKECTVCGAVVATAEISPDYIDAPFTVTTAHGDDVTGIVTDGDQDTYVDGDSHWYFPPEGPIWTIQNGVLVIGGTGVLDADQNFGRFNDEIDTIIVAPQDPTLKFGGDFGVYDGEILSEIKEGAFAGLTNVTKAYIPANVLLDAAAFDVGVTPTLYRTADKTLTVAPAVTNGIVNENGKTLLKLTVKDDGSDLVLGSGQKIALFYIDGEKNNEAGVFFCSAIKYSELQPTYEDGVFTFDICAPVGPDQFIPVKDSTYVVNLYVLNPDGSIAALGSSEQFAVKCNVEPIYTERTSDFVYLSPENYITVDLGQAMPVDEFSLAFIDSSRYYKWQLYGTNDPTLPLCKWDFLGEKNDTTPSSDGAFAISVGGGFYRYLRAYCSYASSRWTALFAEVAVTARTHPDADFTVTIADGSDVTDLMTDGDFDTCVDGDAHWYWMPEKPVWTIQNGVLVIGGVGTLEAGENFGRFNEEIHTIVVAPQDPTIKYGGDFGVQTGVVLESIASGAFAGLTNVTKAYIPLEVDLASDAFDAGTTPTLFRSASRVLSVAPASGYGIFNEDGKTLLKLTIKNGNDDVVLDEGQKFVVVYTDGEKNNEGGLFFCSALKYSELQPTYENGVFVFDICAPVGPDQFIPIRQATYIANVYIINEDGSIAAQGSSDQFAIRCGDHPIVTERTSDVVYLSNENYITVDLGQTKPVDEFRLAFYDTSDRYYHWQLYGSNDPTLPLCKWDYLGEKSNNDVSSTGFYTVNVGGGMYRCLRAVCAYASNRWTALFAEAEVTLLNHEHRYDQVVFTWDGTTPSAARVCAVCGDETPLEVSVSDEITTEPQYGVPGVRTYTATAVVDGETYVDTHEEEIPALEYHPYDVTRNHVVSIADVSALLDYLSGDASAIAEGADPDLDRSGAADIGDVAVLLDYLAAQS